MNDSLLSKEEVLLKSLYEFYNEKSIDKILPIITGKSTISLRILDYFVTNFSKEFNIRINENNNSNVYQDYKNKLKSYNKRFFDPFCRINKKNMTNKIAFRYSNDKLIITTIGQLNFFRWALRNNIIDYVISNHLYINKEMIKFTTNKKSKKKDKINIDNIKESCILNTTLDFGYKKYNIRATKLEDNNFDIAKLEFPNN